jgi:hypothetical protein
LRLPFKWTPSVIAVRRMCWKRRVEARARWHMRDRQRTKFSKFVVASAYRFADVVLLKPSIGRFDEALVFSNIGR